MILIALAVINVLATIVLLLSIYGMANYHKIKIDSQFVATMLIAIMFVVCAITLSFKSLGYYLIYALIVAGIDLFLIMASGASLRGIAASLFISFICWPQCICFLLFLLMHTEVFENDQK